VLVLPWPHQDYVLPCASSLSRVELWEGKDLGGIRVLLTNPRWERPFLKFLELSGVMADGTDEDDAREAEERVALRS
jgi:hypothetical protein